MSFHANCWKLFERQLFRNTKRAIFWFADLNGIIFFQLSLCIICQIDVLGWSDFHFDNQLSKINSYDIAWIKSHVNMAILQIVFWIKKTSSLHIDDDTSRTIKHLWSPNQFGCALKINLFNLYCVKISIRSSN